MNNESDFEGIVYVLTNPAMPGLVKIGITTRSEIGTRMGELYTTGVPLPFECSFAGRTNDLRRVERALHGAFAQHRINSSREFFKIEEGQATELLRIICSEDVTPDVKHELDKVDDASKEASERFKSRRPNLDFDQMNIPAGSKLYSTVVDDEFCTVSNNRKVRFRGSEMSLTKATRLCLENNYNVAPTPYWTFEGRNLSDIYNEIYSEE